MSAFDAPTAFLYGYVDTGFAGYRKVSLGGSVKTVAEGHYRFDAYLTAVNSAISSAGWAVAASATGLVTLTKASGTAAVVWTDRLGWLLGFDREAGDGEGTVGSVVARRPSPAAIPLLGATWDQVSITQERQFMVDRSQRGHGYVFGSARIWRWQLTMDHTALKALKTGWCLGDTVVVSAAGPTTIGSDSAWSTSNTGGYMAGTPIGIESVQWIDTLHNTCTVSLLITEAGP